MKRIITPWANSGTKNTVPDTAVVPDVGVASYPIGFTPKNATPLTAGGVPVSEGDMNGVLNDVTGILAQNAQGIYFSYDSTFATAISGYPVNAVLAKAGAIGHWLNTTAGNTTNPDTGGSGWIDFSPKAIQNCQYNHATAGGTSDAITATYTPAYTAWVDGMTFFVKITIDNATPTPTVSPNGLTAKTIVKSPIGGVGSALAASDLSNGMIAEFKYSATLNQVICQNPAASTTVPVGTVLEYAGSGAAPAGYVLDGSILSRAAYPALFALYVTSSGFTSQTFSCTNSVPGVLTKAAHGFTGGERLRLFATGSLPGGLYAYTDYFVEKIDANTFYLTTSIFGIATRLNTTSTGSGVLTYLQSFYGLGDGSTTFNTPDIRGLFTRGLDGGRGIDTGRVLGTVQKGSIMPADTNYTDAGYTVGLSTSSSVTPLLTMGQDALNVSNYAGASMLAATVYESYTSTMSSNGVARPSNIAVQHIIKY